MPNSISSTLKKYFGYDEFRPLQIEIINSVLAGLDNFVLMPTGGGKSLCFQLPALELHGLTLVISPLIALMKDQVDSLKANGISAEFINSTLPAREIARLQDQALIGKLKILYIAPERMASNGFKIFLKNLNLSLIAVDEAHCISEWGHDFRPEYRNLKMLKNLFPQTPIIALTATATERVRQDILKELGIGQAKIFISSFDRPNLNLRVVKKKNALEKLLALLKNYKNESVIIYCFSRKDTENLANELNNEGFKARPYHAGLETEKRKTTQELFIKDEINIIVATIAFGMGIDKPNVRLIVHYTFPKSLEGYYQEVGRAGRDGLPSDCVMFYTYADARKHRFFLDEIIDEKVKQQAEQKLKEVMEYAGLNSCRRRYILSYFGETYLEENCRTCDCCNTEKNTFDATIIAQKILSAILRTNSHFGAGYIINVLKGKLTDRISNLKHDKLSVFNIVNDFSDNGLREIIKQLIDYKLIIKTNGEYPILTVTVKGQQFLTQREKLKLIAMPTEKIGDDERKIKELIYDQMLFDKLRVLRKQIADKLNVPAFVIFSDISLQEMSYYFPANSENFSLISGVGACKLESFGKDFLKVIVEHIKENNLSSKEICKGRSKTKLPRHERSLDRDTSFITIDLLNRKLAIVDMAKARGLAPSTIASHIEGLINSGVKINLAYLKPHQEVYEKIKTAFQHCGDEKLRPVFEYLKEKYDYETIRLVRLIMKTEA
ncbi:MAG: DNA helicase RecQ [Patescibacteria group bacterium]